jgi:hypothetical protein
MVNGDTSSNPTPTMAKMGSMSRTKSTIPMRRSHILTCTDSAAHDRRSARQKNVSNRNNALQKITCKPVLFPSICAPGQPRRLVACSHCFKTQIARRKNKKEDKHPTEKCWETLFVISLPQIQQKSVAHWLHVYGARYQQKNSGKQMHSLAANHVVATGALDDGSAAARTRFGKLADGSFRPFVVAPLTCFPLLARSTGMSIAMKETIPRRTRRARHSRHTGVTNLTVAA